MKIFAIDPGTNESAWCELIDGKRLDSDKWANAKLLECLRMWGGELPVLAIEMIASYGMAVGKEVFETVLWIGRYMEAWERHGGTVKLIYRREVKLFHCQSARATDANIRAALLDRFGPGREHAVGTKRAPGPLYGIKGDEWSALAVALTAEAAIAPAKDFMQPKTAAPELAHADGNPF